MPESATVYAAAVVGGGISGVRSMTGPALVSRLPEAPTISKVLPVLAAGEAIADKLPFMPDRTIAPSVAWRAAAGAITGASISKSQRKSGWVGAVLGAAAAVGATYGAFHLRRKLTKDLNVPDTLVGLAEDAVVGLAMISLRRTLG